MSHPLLEDWVRENIPADEMRWKKSATNQFIFFRDRLPGAAVRKELWRDQEVREKVAPRVISTHTSKSIKLPVIEIVNPEDVVFTIRDNFYDYKVSVSSPYPIEVDFADLFDPGVAHAACYFEGFPGGWNGKQEGSRIYGAYQDDNCQFSVSLVSEHEVYMFLWLITRCPK